MLLEGTGSEVIITRIVRWLGRVQKKRTSGKLACFPTPGLLALLCNDAPVLGSAG